MCTQESGILFGEILVCLYIVSLHNYCNCVAWDVRIWGNEEKKEHFLSPQASELTAPGKQFEEIILMVRINQWGAS